MFKPSTSKALRRILPLAARRTLTTHPRLLRPRDPEILTFDAPSRPQTVHSRPVPKRELPEAKSSVAFYGAVGVLVVSIWGAFILHATNQERLSSSVVQRILVALQSPNNAKVVDALGEGVVPEPAWYMLGEPWIAGAINLLQGKVDVSFRVRGNKGSGTVYFSSIRKTKGSAFTVLRFKLIRDDGAVVWLDDTTIQD